MTQFFHMGGQPQQPYFSDISALKIEDIKNKLTSAAIKIDKQQTEFKRNTTKLSTLIILLKHQ